MHLVPDQPIGRPSFELSEDQLATVVDLLCTGIELLSQLGQGLFTLDRGQGHLRLERRCVIPAGTSAHQFSSAQPSYGCRSRELPLIPLSEFTEPALWSIYCGDRNNLLSLRTETDFQSFSRAGASTNLRCSTTDCPAEKLSMMYGKTNRE